MSSSDSVNKDTPTYAFTGFVLETRRGSLHRGEIEVKLRHKSFEVLRYLVEHSGRLMTREDIIGAVWDGVAVTDDVVTQSILDIRKALDDKAQTIVRTVPRRGYVLDVPVARVADSRQQTGGRATYATVLRKYALPIGGTLLVMAIGVWLVLSELRNTQTEAQDRISIAVLAFEDLSPDGDLGYFADGISEEILNALAQVSTLRVIARTSSFYFDDQVVDIATIGERLDVTHVLEGSVRRAGNAIRVTVQLIDVATEEHIWSQVYDRALGDIFAVQDDISRSIRNLFLITIEDPADLRSSVDPRAYRYFLQAMHLMRKIDKTVEDDAERLLRRALDIDPQYAAAWRELSRLHYRAIGSGSSLVEDITLARETLDKALELAPDDGASIAYRAWHAAEFDGEIEAAARGFARALALAPSDEHVIRTSLIFSRAIGDLESAVSLAEYNVDRNPMCKACYYFLAGTYLTVGMNAEAVAAMRQFQRVLPDGDYQLGNAYLLSGQPEAALTFHAQSYLEVFRLQGTAMALHDLGRFDESQAALDALATAGNSAQVAQLTAMAYAYIGEDDRAFEALRRYVTLAQGDTNGETVWSNLIWLGYWLRSALFENLHLDPRWPALLEELGLSDAELAPARSHPITPPAGWSRSRVIERLMEDTARDDRLPATDVDR